MKPRSVTKIALVTVSALLITVLAIVSWAGCAGTAGKGEWPTEVFLSTTPGSYAPMVALAEHWTRHSPIAATASEATGAVVGYELLRKGEVEFAYGTDAHSWAALHGEKNFTTKYTDIRSLFGMAPSVGTIVAQKGITSIPDLKGKRFAVLPWASSWSYNELALALLQEYGLTKEDVILIEGRTSSEQRKMMREGAADAAFIPGSIGIPPMRELATVRELSFPFVPDDKIESLSKRALHGIVKPLIMPAGTYRGQDRDVNVLAMASSILTRVDMPDDLIYELTKATWEYEDELLQLEGKSKKVALKYALTSTQAPYHTGAIKYYKEKGLWDSRMAALQKSLLKEIGAKK
jgi:hypothetical protein